MLVISTKLMKDAYCECGSVTRIVKLKGVIRNSSAINTVLYLCGQDRHLQHVLFGVIILKYESLDLYKQGFSNFFAQMDNLVPRVIIR